MAVWEEAFKDRQIRAKTRFWYIVSVKIASILPQEPNTP